MKPNRSALAAALLIAVLVGSIGTSSAQDPTPTVSLGSERVAPGDVIQVRGVHWPAGDVVTIELCGNDGLDLTADCDIRNSTVTGVRNSTEFLGLLEISQPPKPCPCIVRVSAPSYPLDVTVPIDFPSAGFIPSEQTVPDADISRLLAITEIDVEEKGEWKTWFGLPPERVVKLKIVNTGTVTIRDTTLVVTAGRGSDPNSIIGSRDILALEPGEDFSVIIPFELDPLSFGRFTTRAEVGGVGTEIVARAQTSSYPWVLIALALVLIQLVLLKVRNRVRARIEDQVAEGELDEAEEPPEPGGGTEAAGPIEATIEPGPAEIDLYAPDAHEDEEAPDVDAEQAEEGPAELEIIISQELDAVFDQEFQTCGGEHTQDERRAMVVELAHAASARVAARSGLNESETDALDIEITEAVLASFGLGAEEQD